jgi:putative SOS response-associated peptidase YedK
MESYTIITDQLNEVAAKIHNRMPIIIDPQDYDPSSTVGALLRC